MTQLKTFEDKAKTKYKCTFCEGRGFNYTQPYGQAVQCSLCKGTGYAQDLDLYNQKKYEKEKHRY